MQWPAITGSWDYVAADEQPELWNDSPAEGHLPGGVADRLAAVLARHTATPDDCWFGLWDGHLHDGAPGPPRLSLAERDLLLVRGPLSLASANFLAEPAEQGPTLWFPDDRSWCVVTDIDLMSSYVGSSAGAITATLAAAGLETFPAAAGDPVTPDSDPVNPSPEA